MGAVPRRLTAPAIGTTTLWDRWNASRPTLEIMRTKRIWSLLLLAVIFLARHRGKLTVLPRPFIAEFKRGEGHTSIRKELAKQGWSKTGDGEGMGRKRKGIGIHPCEVPSDFSAVVAPMARAHVSQRVMTCRLHVLSSELPNEKRARSIDAVGEDWGETEAALAQQLYSCLLRAVGDRCARFDRKLEQKRLTKFKLSIPERRLRFLGLSVCGKVVILPC